MEQYKDIQALDLDSLIASYNKEHSKDRRNVKSLSYINIPSSGISEITADYINSLREGQQTLVSSTGKYYYSDPNTCSTDMPSCAVNRVSVPQGYSCIESKISGEITLSTLQSLQNNMSAISSVCRCDHHNSAIYCSCESYCGIYQATSPCRVHSNCATQVTDKTCPCHSDLDCTTNKCETVVDTCDIFVDSVDQCPAYRCPCNSYACGNHCTCQDHTTSNGTCSIFEECTCNTHWCSCNGHVSTCDIFVDATCSCQTHRCGCDSYACGTVCKCQSHEIATKVCRSYEACVCDDDSCSCNSESCVEGCSSVCGYVSCKLHRVTCACYAEPTDCTCEQVCTNCACESYSAPTCSCNGVCTCNKVNNAETCNCNSHTCSCENVLDPSITACNCHSHCTCNKHSTCPCESYGDCTCASYWKCSCESQVDTKPCICNNHACSCEKVLDPQPTACNCHTHCTCEQVCSSDVCDTNCSCFNHVCNCESGHCPSNCGCDGYDSCTCNSHSECSCDGNCDCNKVCVEFQNTAGCRCHSQSIYDCKTHGNVGL